MASIPMNRPSNLLSLRFLHEVALFTNQKDLPNNETSQEAEQARCAVAAHDFSGGLKVWFIAFAFSQTNAFRLG